MSEPSGVERPIFLIGTGRCGSTLLHRLLVHHPDLSWLSGVLAARPGAVGMNRAVVRAARLPAVGPWVHRRINPRECYGYWTSLFAGFARPVRDLQSTDVTEPVRLAVREGLSRLQLPGGERLLVKLTGWPRIGFLKDIFPDAQFIRIDRDGRASAVSWMHSPDWHGWQGPGQWRWGPLSDERQARWLASDRSYPVLAGLQWEVLMEAHVEAAADVPAGDVVTTTYEQLCARPQETVANLLREVRLPGARAVRNAIAEETITNSNATTVGSLPDGQRELLTTDLAASLERFTRDPDL